MSATTSGPGRFRGALWAIATGAVIVLVVAALAVVNRSDSGGPEVPAAATFAARRGPLIISVSESGTIKSREQVIIKSEVEGQTTILFLVPEGTRVSKGDPLVELDSSGLLERQAEKQITVLNAESAFVRAREGLEVVRNQATADIAQAELDSRFAVEDQQNYLLGEYPNARTEAQAKITLAGEELSRVEETARWSRKLFDEKYISATELQADVLAENRARLELELATKALDLLENYTMKRRLAELDSDVEQTALALERVKRKATADVAQAESELKAKDFELQRQRDLLEKINRQIERCKINSPTDGLVVYATTGQGGPRGNNEPLQEGQSIRERQEIIHLPTTASVTAEISIHESNLGRVRPGQLVRISVDALPGRTFTGTVASVAPLPDAQSVWMNPDLKLYKTQVDLGGDVEGLRTGMSCRAEFLVEQHADAVYVPVQAVLRVAGKPTVYLVGADGRPRPKAVELGLDNNRMAHIKGGLDAGDVVLLDPPLAEAASSEDNQAAWGDGARAGPTGAPPPGPGGGPGSPEAGSDQPRGQRPEMTPEQREEMRKRFESMTPEQREQAGQRRRPSDTGGDSTGRGHGGEGRSGDGDARPGGPSGQKPDAAPGGDR